MRRSYAVVIPRGGLAKVGVERLSSRRGLHGFPDASTGGDAFDFDGDGCAVEAAVRSGMLIGRRCLLQRTLYDEQALNRASEPRIQRILIIPP
jgi:hypothetical protein